MREKSMITSTPAIPPYHERLIEPYLTRLATELSAFMVVGPRAVGKTRTVERRAATTIRLNVAGEAVAFRADADAALLGLDEPVLLDEWQEVPDVLRAVAQQVNADPRPSRYFLTGSARAEVENTPWPGTGRLQRVPIYPMTVRERCSRTGAEGVVDKLVEGVPLTAPRTALNLRDYVDLLLVGGFPYPALALSDPVARAAWFDSYVDDLVTHDVEQLEDSKTKPRDPLRLRRYFEAYALTSAGVSDHKTIFEAAQVQQKTAARYAELLEKLYVVEQVQPWMTNRLSRLTHQPKRYVIDPALAAHVLRLDAQGILADGNLLGRMLDTFVAAQLRPEVAVSSHRVRQYHVRTEGGRHEVDIVLELGGDRVIGIEVKAAAAPDAADAKHLTWLREQLGDRFVVGVVFCSTPRVYQLSDRIVAAPIASIWTD